MKKEPGVNGEWIPVSIEERVANATIPSIVSLGIPAAVQTQYAFSDGWGEGGWILPVVVWVYGLLFWFMSTAIDLLRPKRWEWTEAAIEEKYRYWSAARVASSHFWGHWWVRFPIGLLFIAYGVHTLLQPDFTAQWISWIMLMCAFITPFVFVAEMALLPLSIVIVVGYLALVTFVPMSLMIMLGFLGMLATIMMAAQNRVPKPAKKDRPEAKEGKSAEAPADAATAGEAAAGVAEGAVQSGDAVADGAATEAASDAGPDAAAAEGEAAALPAPEGAPDATAEPAAEGDPAQGASKQG
ncbi:MAG: hypothetical protein RL404_576 [Pseudomonadota bacterium]